jgi:hypothetical protein
MGRLVEPNLQLVGQPRRDLEASKAGPEDHDTRSRYLS